MKKTEFIFKNKIYCLIVQIGIIFFLNDMWLNFKFNISLILQFFSFKIWYGLYSRYFTTFNL